MYRSNNARNYIPKILSDNTMKDGWKIGENIREVIFGVEDGAIGNLGLVVGMAQAYAPNTLILLAGFATMLAQFISMFAGNYLSIKSEKEYFAVRSKSRTYGKAYSSHKSALYSSFMMGFSVIIGAIVPLSVFFIFPSHQGIIPSIATTLIGLFVLGVFKTKYTHRHWFASGMEVLLVGTIAAAVGYGVGTIFNI